MLPVRHRGGFYRIAEHVGFTLRRLLFGRLVGMVFEGFFTWFMLTIGGVPMAALLGLVTGVLAFIPNIGAITSGVLMVAVGFSAGPNQGLWAIFVYFFVQNIDGYLVVPYIARRTVDLPPALVLAMQLLMGALFGILGVLFADPILATMKVVLVDVSQRAGGDGRASSPRSSPRAKSVIAAAAPRPASARRWEPASRHGCRTRGWHRAGSARPRAAHGRSRAWTGYGPCSGRLPASASRLRAKPGMVWLASIGTGPLPALEFEHLAVLQAPFIFDQNAVLGVTSGPLPA